MSARHGALPMAMDFYAISTSTDPFEAPAAACRLVLYAQPEAGRGLIQLLDPDQTTVLRWWTLGSPYLIEDDLPPGSYRLALSVAEEDYSSPWQTTDGADTSVNLSCQAGQAQVFRHSVKTGFWSAEVNRELTSVPPGAAREEVIGQIPVRQPSDPGWLAVKPYQGEQP